MKNGGQLTKVDHEQWCTMNDSGQWWMMDNVGPFKMVDTGQWLTMDIGGQWWTI